MVRTMADVVMFCTASCPFCIRAEQLLRQKGVDIEKVRVDLDPSQREVMIQRTGRRTVPQIFVGDTHVGGCDDLFALDRSGGLDPLLRVGA
jgi:glutaredoxin 3